jgi:hypothetical protein
VTALGIAVAFAAAVANALAGTALLILAWPLQILALTLAPITVVQPTFATFQLVLLAVARFRLHEQVGLIELIGVLSIVTGIALLVSAAPKHTVAHPAASRLAIPLVVVGGLALLVFILARLSARARLALVLGAGLGYAWADFANKLVANGISSGNALAAILWLGATLGFGALAFLEENSALQTRPAITVAPVIGAVQEPLPVLMALWAGLETWATKSHPIALLVIGLLLVAVGAATLGRSKAVARVAGEGR